MTFVVEDVCFVTDRGYTVTRSAERAREDSGVFVIGGTVASTHPETGEPILSTVVGIQWFIEPQQGLLLQGVKRSDLAVGQIWTVADEAL